MLGALDIRPGNRPISCGRDGSYPAGRSKSSPARAYQNDTTNTFHQRPSISKRPHAGPMQVPLPTAQTSPSPPPPAHHQPTTSAARGHSPPANARRDQESRKRGGNHTTLHLPAWRGRCGGLRAASARGVGGGLLWGIASGIVLVWVGGGAVKVGWGSRSSEAFPW